MENLTPILLVILIGLVIYTLFESKKGQNKKEDDSKDKIFLEVIDQLRKDVHETSNKTRQELQDTQNRSRLEIQEQLDKMNTKISDNFKDNNKALQSQHKQSVDIVQEVSTKLAKIEETNKKVVSFAEQMKSLENILKNPKQRGILGEYFLETLLGNVLPPNQFQMQYSFKNGEIVDAVIFINDQIVPIDSKFSLENYNRFIQEQDKTLREKLEKEFKADIKKRIDETAKYIRTEENTMDFAFMFIPAEGIYYNLLAQEVGTANINTADLIEYAFKKHVIIVSPTSFFAYLETVLQGLQALKMAKSIKDVKKRVDELGKHLNAYQENIRKMGSQLGTVVNTYNNSTNEFRKIDKDIIKVSEGESQIGVDLEFIEKPLLED